MEKPIYLVTSAAGFMGGIVVRKLLERGDEVRSFVLRGDPGIRFVPKESEIFEGDVCDMESLERFFTVPEGRETIMLHIASLVTIDEEYNQKVMDVNVGGTKNIISCCLSHPECKKLVYVSSTGAIPELPMGQPIREVDYFDETKVRGCYSQSKALASQEVLDAVHHKGLQACIVHPSGIMGPGDYAIGETTGTIIRILNGELPAGIDGSFNLCDARDLADGIIAAVEKGRVGECYILGSGLITFKEFANTLLSISGGKKLRFFLPIFAANWMGSALERQAKSKGEKAVMTPFAVYNLSRNNVFDSSKARQELGYTTRSCQETLQDQITWMMEQGMLQNE